MALAVHLFPAVGSDQHAINSWSPKQMSEICGAIVQFCEFQLCNNHSRLVSQQMKAKTYEVCNCKMLNDQVILIVSNCSDLKEGCNRLRLPKERQSASEINVCRHYSVSAVTGWCVCGGGGGRSFQQSLSDCTVCAHYSVSMCRHTYVNQQRVLLQTHTTQLQTTCS